MSDHPLLDDKTVDFILRDVQDVATLLELDAFRDQDLELFDMYIAAARRLAREKLWPAFPRMDREPPTFEGGRIKVHPLMRDLYREMVELGCINASRGEDVGGQGIPHTVSIMATTYLMAANASAVGYAFLTTGAAHLIESFGSEELKRDYMTKMYDGEWTGTMALTEPQAGSGLADVATTAKPQDDGSYRIAGSKIFISGADQDITDNVVHLTLARIDGAPQGTKGISLFVVPRHRVENGTLVDNDVVVSQMIHKIGWKGIPSLALNYGENGACHGYLLGEPGRGLKYMFQMMNEARLMVGAHGVATAAAGYYESLAYAKERKQGRRVTDKDATKPPVPIIEHADVRRMLLRQKAIVEGGLCLLATTSRHIDLAHAGSDEQREHSGLLLDLLTPVAKSFPAEYGFEANCLALQIHGGYGYSSEYLPEAWMRDQKLNSIHEGTTGIQGMDLLGRKVVEKGGARLAALGREISTSLARARESGVSAEWCDGLASAFGRVVETTKTAGQRGLAGDVESMLSHSTDYLQMMSIAIIAWQWLQMAAAAARGGTRGDDFYAGKRQAAAYWMNTELPRVEVLATRIASGERSFLDMRENWF